MSKTRKTILYIEDDREAAKLIAEGLSDRGFDVVIAHDGYVGLISALRKITDIVLCNVNLPRISGFEVLECLNALPLSFGRVPFVFLTGASDRHNELLGRSLGADDFITRPIDFDILDSIIRARLIGGVVRHEIPAKLPKPNDPHAQAALRFARDKGSAKRAVRGQIVELTNAPAVDFHLDNAEPMPGTAAQTGAGVKAAMDRPIRR
jgi:DNA-binding response OmpR family regulator